MGKQCCGLNFIKNVLNTLNIIFLLTGISVVGVAGWTLYDRYQYVSLLASVNYPIIVLGLLSAGCLVIISAFMGCYAVHTENRPLLIIYIFALSLIFVIEAMVGIFAFIYNETLHAELQHNLQETFRASYRVDATKTDAIDFLQQQFRCCGAEGYFEWRNSSWLQMENGTAYKVPDSCCKTLTIDCGRRDHPSNIHNYGCLEQMEQHMKDHLVILSAVGLGICVIQIFGVFFAIKLYLKLRRTSFNDMIFEEEFLNKH